MTESINHTSFVLLDRKKKKRIYDFFQGSPLAQTTTEAGNNHARLEEYIRKLEDVGTLPPAFILYNTKVLLIKNPELFATMSEEERIALDRNLRLVFYGLCVTYQTDAIVGRRQHLKSYIHDMEKCARLIRNLELAKKNQPIEHHENEKFHQNTAFLEEFSVGKTVYLKQWMGDFNVWRQYWVWAGLTLRMALSMVPPDFYQVHQTVDVATKPQPVLGIISWLLYLTRFLINFMLVLRHSIKGPWMSKAEKQRIDDNGGMWSAFQEQLAKKKFILINDLVWGIQNCLTFFYFIGDVLGPIGNVVTSVILLGDAVLMSLISREARQQHQAEMRTYQTEIDLLQARINDKTLRTRGRNITEFQLAQLIAAQKECATEWTRKSKQLDANFYMSAGICAAYSLVVTPWAHIAAQATATALSFTGAGIGFILFLIYVGYNAYIDVSHAKASRLSALQQCKLILEAETDPTIRQENFIRYKDLMAAVDYQTALANYHQAVFIRAVVIRALIPLAIFTAFTFATGGIGWALIGLEIVVAVVSHFLIEQRKPRATSAYKFKPDEYDKFSKSEELEKITQELAATSKTGILSVFNKKDRNRLENPVDADKSLLSGQK
jgi:hypothetical protein